MAEFSEVMKQWMRICGANNGICSNNEYICPMYESGLCNKSVSKQTDNDRSEGEKIIMAWAAEHPEPVYPTWWKYMCMIGVIPNTLGDKTLGEITIERLMSTNIPADIAQRLGIEPKEGLQ